MASQKLTGRAASMAKRQMQVSGKRDAATSQPIHTPAPKPKVNQVQGAVRQGTANKGSSARAASVARRMAMSSKGKKGIAITDRQRTDKEIKRGKQEAVAKAPCNCGGACCEEAKPATPQIASMPVTARVQKRPRISQTQNGRLVSKARRSAMSARGKQGLEQHRQGMSSASLARQANPDISSRELARAVREQRSQVGGKGVVSRTAGKKTRSRNGSEKAVTGTRVGHSKPLTGDEAGLCHPGITGTQYLAAKIFEDFCQDRTPAYPVKVSQTETLHGSRVTTAGKVGASERMTGADAGSCSHVTGSEYLGREHFTQRCDTPVQPGATKVSHSHTQRGMTVSGPKASRAEKVTGNEKGTCKAVTGTPYAGFEDQEAFCSKTERSEIGQRQSPVNKSGARDITGIQPGLRGVHFTGAQEGACQVVSGTPYLGRTEMKAVCNAAAATEADADFPQVIGQATAETEAPLKMPAAERVSKVTGAGKGDNSAITGTFSLGKGKVTGTEQARFDKATPALARSEPAVDESSISRVTGEGLDLGLNITGDDWNRGKRVTGTEGSSAVVRNPSRRGQTSVMQPVVAKREPVRDRPSATVTGGSGGSEGSAVTVSGGARG